MGAGEALAAPRAPGGRPGETMRPGVAWEVRRGFSPALRVARDCPPASRRQRWLDAGLFALAGPPAFVEESRAEIRKGGAAFCVF